MAIRVYHAINPTWGHGTHPTFPHEFAHVATVDVPDDLHYEVFTLTNSIECGWWDNAGVTAHTEASTFHEVEGIKGTRSTSVGDLIILSDGRILRCASFGWDDITETVAEFWTDVVADHREKAA
jgi:hypothetical protein